MSLQRKLAVNEGRAMIRVRNRKTKEPATIGVCPGCWNDKTRREVLLKKLIKMNLMAELLLSAIFFEKFEINFNVSVSIEIEIFSFIVPPFLPIIRHLYHN